MVDIFFCYLAVLFTCLLSHLFTCLTGLFMLLQVYFYQNARCRTEMFDKDIIVIQVWVDIITGVTSGAMLDTGFHVSAVVIGYSLSPPSVNSSPRRSLVKGHLPSLLPVCGRQFWTTLGAMLPGILSTWPATAALPVLIVSDKSCSWAKYIL